VGAIMLTAVMFGALAVQFAFAMVAMWAIRSGAWPERAEVGDLPDGAEMWVYRAELAD
jgi:hypothetical protein